MSESDAGGAEPVPAALVGGRQPETGGRGGGAIGRGVALAVAHDAAGSGVLEGSGGALCVSAADAVDGAMGVVVTMGVVIGGVGVPPMRVAKRPAPTPITTTAEAIAACFFLRSRLPGFVISGN